MTDTSLPRCPGCRNVEYDCTCAEGGFLGQAKTADGVSVTGSDVVFWKFDPSRAFRAMNSYSAIPIGGGSSEPMVEMYSTREAAEAAHLPR